MTVKQHMAKVAALGCILCRRLDLGESPACLHHPKTGGKRASDWDVIPLCHFHHQGKDGIHGLGRKRFEKFYEVTEMELLEQVKGLVQS
jgi:hypothetical protein